MHAIPYPQPRTSGGRPPIDPPTTTTFDSSPEGFEEPAWRLISDSVKTILQHAAKADGWQLPMILTLLRERKRMVMRELNFERMFMPDLMPPLIENMYSMEHTFEENHAIRVYNALLDRLEEAESCVIAKMKDQNIELPPSEL